jgi:hypothetical protein
MPKKEKLIKEAINRGWMPDFDYIYHNNQLFSLLETEEGKFEKIVVFDNGKWNEPISKTLKLQAGRSYKRKDGEFTGELEYFYDDRYFYDPKHGLHYTQSGTCFNNWRNRDFDIDTEYHDINGYCSPPAVK